MEQADSTQKKNVLVAYPAPKIGDELKKHFEAGGLNVLDVVVVIDHLFEKLELLLSEGIQLHGLVISSHFATILKDKRLEFLSDTIQKIHEEFRDTSLIFLSGEKDNHPLHAELVAMGIYNIFLRTSSDQLDVYQLIKCIDSPMPYSHTAKFRDFDKSIPWRRFVGHAIDVTEESKQPREEIYRNQTDPIQQKPSIKEDVKTTEKQIHQQNYTPKKQEKPEKQETQSKVTPKSENKLKAVTDIMVDELDDWQLPPTKQKNNIRDRIVGKAIIGVTSIEKGCGKTHTAVSIANYLARFGYSVKLIECDNRNNEYANIERSYGGKNADPSRNTEFDINGVTFVKSGSKEAMAFHLTSEHTHIVLDLGCYNTTEYIDEFHRANYQLIVASGSEWKQPLIHQFLKSNKGVDQSNWKFIIPLIERQSLRDIRSNVENNKVFGLPYHPDPFKSYGHIDDIFDDLFMTGDNGTRKITIVAAGTIFLVIAIFAAWYLLK